MAVLSIILCALAAAFALAADYTNPIEINSADPFMVWDDGMWYLVNTGSDVGLINATTVAGLKDAPRVNVYNSSSSEYSQDFWAPEIHNFDGTQVLHYKNILSVSESRLTCWNIRWYIFTTAATPSDANDNRRILVLKSTTSTPAGPYTFQAVLGNDLPNDTSDKWAIDPTVLFDGGNHYLVWSCHDQDAYNAQSLCIGELNGPTELLNRVVISTPTNGWEQNGFPVNEGPSAVYYNGRTFLSFSASSCATPNYSLGILAYNGAGILNPSSWSKSGPWFTSANGDYGPGHNCFVLNPRTTQDWWQVYHATPNSGGGCDASRNTFFQPVTFNGSNFPVFGQPEPTGVTYPGPSGE